MALGGHMKNEPARSFKAELLRASLKTEPPQHPRLKAELQQHASFKVESFRSALKAEPYKSELDSHSAAVRGESKVEGSLTTVRNLKAELKCETSNRISELVDRGLKLRALAEKVKGEVAKEPLRKVKKEKGKRKTRRKGSLARRNASREVMNRAVPLSPELAELVGARELSRPEVAKRVWAHCRDHGLLNPADKREALFDERLQRLFGQQSARVFDLHSLMVPHLDYDGRWAASHVEDMPATVGPAKYEKAKGEASQPKRQPEGWTKAEQSFKLEHALFAEVVKLQAAKREREAMSPTLEPVAKRDWLEASKRETLTTPPAPTSAVLMARLQAILPRLCEIDLTSVTVECRVPTGVLSLEAVARPLGEGQVLRQQCTVELRESVEGDLEAHAQARLVHLDPAQAYHLVVETQGVSSAGATLPQRASPVKWTPHEAQVWCGSLQLPELARKVVEYKIDGATLLVLGEEDLRALGLRAPFLLRRVLTGLQKLRGS